MNWDCSLVWWYSSGYSSNLTLTGVSVCWGLFSDVDEYRFGALVTIYSSKMSVSPFIIKENITQCNGVAHLCVFKCF